MKGRTLIAGLQITTIAICTLLLCVWFVVHSTAISKTVQLNVDRETAPGALSFSHLEWGPHPFQLTVYDLALHDRSGNALLRSARTHVHLDLQQLKRGKRLLDLRVFRIEMDEFELTLEWNQAGRLTLGDAFRTRSFAIAREERPPFQLSLMLAGITLRRGRLHLVWPKFGFRFDDIHASGEVGVANGELSIEVPTLDSGAGTFWTRGAPRPVQEAVSEVLPDNALSNDAPEGLHVPFSSVTIRDFSWAGEGFKTDLLITVNEENEIHTIGSMSFPEEGLRHDLKANVRLSGPLLSALTHSAFQGQTQVQASAQGLGLASRVQMSATPIQTIALEGIQLDDLAIHRALLDLRGSQVELGMQLSLTAGKLAELELNDTRIELAGEAGYPEFTATSFLDRIRPWPTSPMDWLRVLPVGTTTAAVSVQELSSQRLRYQQLDLQEVHLDDLSVRLASATVSAALQEASASGCLKLTGTASIGLQLGLTSLSLNTKVQTAFHAIDPALARQIFAHAPTLMEGGPSPLNLIWTLEGDLTDPDSFEAQLRRGTVP